MKYGLMFLVLCVALLSCRTKRATLDITEHADSCLVAESSRCDAVREHSAVTALNVEMELDSVNLVLEGGNVKVRRAVVRASGEKVAKGSERRVEADSMWTASVSRHGEERRRDRRVSAPSAGVWWVILGVIGFFCLTLWRKH